MTVSHFAKAVIWAAFAAVILAVSAVFSWRLHQPAQMESAYFQSNLYWFILAVGMVGCGVSFRRYAKAEPSHRPDVAFLLIEGGLLIVGWIVMLLRFGGISGKFNAAALTAVNVNILTLMAAPLPPLIYAAVLALSTGIDKKSHRVVAVTLVAALFAAVAATVLAGGWNPVGADALTLT